MEQDLLKLVTFDADQVSRAILKCEEEIRKIDQEREHILQLQNTYRQLLRLNGLPEPVQSTTSFVKIDANLADNMHSEPGPKIADVAVEVIRRSGGRMHGKKILEAVQAAGLMKSAKFPMTQLANALRREPRIQKAPRVRNTWRLREGI